tara:strand:- start:162 stop:356 length:195 start_codon:yes stop_codon:yes gene_type:complete
MNASLEYNVEVLSEHYVERFKQLMENDQIDDANAIGQEYLCNNGEVDDDNYQWLYVNYQFKEAN